MEWTANQYERRRPAPVFDSEWPPNHARLAKSMSHPAPPLARSKSLELDLGRFSQPIHNCRRNIAFFVVDTFHDNRIHILAIQFS
jgi:hypothetical protein